MPMQKMLICFALSVLFLGASINVDGNLSSWRATVAHRAPTKMVRAGLLRDILRGMTIEARNSTTPVASSVMAHERQEASVLDWRGIPCCRTSRHSGRPYPKGDT